METEQHLWQFVTVFFALFSEVQKNGESNNNNMTFTSMSHQFKHSGFKAIYFIFIEINLDNKIN